jgi:tryprostatin B 6-hydroxylase
MGDLAFGKSFHALERGQSHFAIDVIHDSGALTGIFGSARWVIHLLMQLPIPPSLSTITRLINYSADMIKERKTYEPEEPDVMSHIFEAGPFFDNPETESKLLTGDARLLIIAGSDTTASSLTFLLYHLARDPSLVERLREELEQDKIGSGHDFAVANLGSLNYLNALIYECVSRAQSSCTAQPSRQGITRKMLIA